MKKSAFLLAAVTAVALATTAMAQTIAAPAGSTDSGARGVVAITPVDLSGYATNTYVNSVANTANSAYWYGTTAYNTANTAYNTANTANNTANAAYWYGTTAYNSGRVVGNGMAPVSGDGGWTMMPGICVSGYPRHNPWWPGADPCPAGSGFLPTQFPVYTPA